MTCRVLVEIIEPFRPAVVRDTERGGSVGKRYEKRNVVVGIDLAQRQRVVRSAKRPWPENKWEKLSRETRD